MQPPRTVVVGVFESRSASDAAINELRRRGIAPEQVGLLIPGAAEALGLGGEQGTEAEEGAAAGAIAGGVLGGVGGWLVGLGALAIPGLGLAVAAGPLATALAGAVFGAAGGGVVGALVGMGIPEHEAEWYGQRLRAGTVLLTVHADARSDEIRSILRTLGATDVEMKPGPPAAPAARPLESGEQVQRPMEIPGVAPLGPAPDIGPRPGGPTPPLAAAARAPRRRAGRRSAAVESGAASESGTEARQKSERAPTRVSVQEPGRESGPESGPASGIESGMEVQRMERFERGAMERVEETTFDILGFLESIPDSVFYLGTLASVLTSVGLYFAGRKWESLFVGLWSPSVLTMGLFLKLLRPSRERGGISAMFAARR
ncbi:MAG: hypothetical protein HYY04_09110 [Chloroflexi bacterium]|nr:hypothetical protein [Chloroflexota bacterium]